MKIKLTIIAALAAFSLYSQQAPVAAKSEVSPSGSGAVSGAGPLTSVSTIISVPLSTAKIWRLNSKVQALQAQLEASEQGKALKEAQAELQAEQMSLNAKCAAVGMILDYDRTPGSPGKDDLTCVAKPAEPKKDK